MTVKTFIDRPLLSIVISVFIVALGVIALTSLPVEKYPDIAPPAINVWASYPGASAETVQKSVVTPLEEAINGVEGMTYMKSSASNGSASVTVFFEQGANADMAAVNVQNRVIQAQGQLPAEVLQMGGGSQRGCCCRADGGVVQGGSDGFCSFGGHGQPVCGNQHAVGLHDGKDP